MEYVIGYGPPTGLPAPCFYFASGSDYLVHRLNIPMWKLIGRPLIGVVVRVMALNGTRVRSI